MPKILIVEDDQTISKLIAASLSISGYESVPCFDGNEAVHMVRNEEFDLILLDIMLPGLDGFQVMEKIRETGTPVIFLTAMGDVSDRVKGLKSGAEDYTVNMEERSVRRGSEIIDLTPKEYDLLVLFLKHQNVALSRDKILMDVWECSANIETRTVDNHVQRLRKKLGLEDCLKTVFKVGYRLENDL